MIVAMQEIATDEQIQQVIEHLVRMGFSVHRTTGVRQTILAAQVPTCSPRHHGLRSGWPRSPATTGW